MELFAVMTVFFILITMVFVALALFFPEWMGITGKKAQKIIQDHQVSSESTSQDDQKQPKNS